MLLPKPAPFGAEAEDREPCMEGEEETDDDTNNDLEDERDGKPQPGAVKSREGFVRAARQRAHRERRWSMLVRSPAGRIGVLRRL